MRHLLAISGLCIVLTSCTAYAKPRPALSGTSGSPVPHTDWFVNDRTQDSGFSAPKQAAAGFMQTLFAAKRDLLRDDAFKQRFLSAPLRQRIAASLKQCEKWPPGAPGEGHPAAPDPSNKLIFSAWDLPTSYTVSSGHQTGDRAAYEVIYHWGRGTQYEGDRRTTSVILAREKGRWYVDDLYTHNGKFIAAGSFFSPLLR